MTPASIPGGDPRAPHVGELRLRRFRVGELPAPEAEAVGRHTADCGSCRARLAALDDEQRAFEREIPLARFAGGVDRAVRVPRAAARPRRFWLAGAFSLTAAAAGLLLIARGEGGPLSANRTKGDRGDSATIRIADAGGARQRSILPGAAARLAPGERLRMGYRVAQPRHLAALAIDDRGQVTPLYPEGATSLAVQPGPGTVYLPDSVELTGAGRERLYLFLARDPFRVDDAVAATRAAFTRAGPAGLARMDRPSLPSGSAEVSTWLFEKP